MKTKKYQFQLRLSLACLLLACGCASEPTRPRDPDPTQVTCARTDSFGDLRICLPQVPDWVECWRDSSFEGSLAAYETEKGKTLGFYLDPEEYAHPERDPKRSGKRKVEVISIEPAKNVPIDTDTLDHLVDQMASISQDVAWDKVTGEIITPRKMISYTDWGLLDKYTQPNGIRTAVLVQRRGSDHEAPLVFATFNVAMIHQRFVGYFYVVDYEGGASLLEGMRRSDSFGSYLMVGNHP
jgi:hypothetical protein